MVAMMRRKEPVPPDEELIRSAIEGEQRAYQALLQRYQKTVFHIVVKIIRNSDDAQDLVQETFMRAFNTLESYRSEFRFSTWLCKKYSAPILLIQFILKNNDTLY